MQFIASLGVSQWAMHMDLHETTDSDLSEFRPAKASRDGVRCPQFYNRAPLIIFSQVPLPDETIPDGFYIIGTPCDTNSVQRRSPYNPILKTQNTYKKSSGGSPTSSMAFVASPTSLPPMPAGKLCKNGLSRCGRMGLKKRCKRDYLMQA